MKTLPSESSLPFSMACSMAILGHCNTAMLEIRTPCSYLVVRPGCSKGEALSWAFFPPGPMRMRRLTCGRGTVYCSSRMESRKHQVPTSRSLAKQMLRSLRDQTPPSQRSEEHTSELQSLRHLV